MGLSGTMERLEKDPGVPVLLELAGELGGALPTMDRRELSAVQVAIARAHVPADPRAQALREALTMVVSGALQQRAYDEHRRMKLDVAMRGLKESWRKLLEASEPGAVLRPGELASAAGMDRSAVTRELAKMEEAGLIEEMPADLKLIDKRGKYLRLTTLGAEVRSSAAKDTYVKIALHAHGSASGWREGRGVALAFCDFAHEAKGTGESLARPTVEGSSKATSETEVVLPASKIRETP